MSRNPNRQPHHRVRAPFWLAGCLAVGLTAASYLFPGNEHGASNSPGVDFMPGYSVEPLVPGNSDEQAHQGRAKELGVQVCKVVFMSESSTDAAGRHKVIINPILSPANADGGKYILPATVDTNKDGFTIGQTPEDLRNNDYKVVNTDGSSLEGGVMNDNCPTEDVHPVYLKDTATQKPVYELVGDDSPLTSGTALPLNAARVVEDNIVNYQTWLGDDQIKELVINLQR